MGGKERGSTHPRRYLLDSSRKGGVQGGSDSLTPDLAPLHPGPGSSPPSPKGGLAHSTLHTPAFQGQGIVRSNWGTVKTNKTYSQSRQPSVPASPPQPPAGLQDQLQPSRSDGLGAARTFRLSSPSSPGAVTAAAGRES